MTSVHLHEPFGAMPQQHIAQHVKAVFGYQQLHSADANPAFSGTQAEPHNARFGLHVPDGGDEDFLDRDELGHSQIIVSSHDVPPRIGGRLRHNCDGTRGRLRVRDNL